MSDFVVIVDRSAGNETIGEMWQETKIFPYDAPLQEVMNWAFKVSGESVLAKHSRSRITLTKPHPKEEI